MAALRQEFDAIADLTVSNPLLEDRSALSEAWERDGYLFFRDMLDNEALSRFRRAYLDELAALGFVAPGAQEPEYNGRSFAGDNSRPAVSLDAFAGLRLNRPEPWIAFADDPNIVAFVGKVMGCTPRRLPVAECRMMPPDAGEDLVRDRFIGMHQDGFFNEGYDATTFWVPVWDAPRAAGGLAVAQGTHRGPFLHDATRPPNYPIPPGAVPDASWRTADYRAGDVVFFHHRMVHSGLRNRSDKYFRLSFDVRFLNADEPGPVFGRIVALSDESIAVQQADGAVHTVLIDENSVCRGVGPDFGRRFPAHDITRFYRPGLDVMTTSANGRLRMLRMPKV